LLLLLLACLSYELFLLSCLMVVLRHLLSVFTEMDVLISFRLSPRIGSTKLCAHRGRCKHVTMPATPNVARSLLYSESAGRERKSRPAPHRATRAGLSRDSLLLRSCCVVQIATGALWQVVEFTSYLEPATGLIVPGLRVRVPPSILSVERSYYLPTMSGSGGTDVILYPSGMVSIRVAKSST
jgi:hypothetical protein